LRAFVAIDVTAIEPIRKLQNEISSAAGWSPRDVKPVEAQNFHFTLIFLGEIEDSDVGRIESKLSALQFDAFDINYSGVGAFPNSRAARVIWVGVDAAGSEKLAALAGQVVSALAEMGFSPDKPFSPHLTIFRVKTRLPVNVESLTSKFTGIIASDHIDSVHLKKSQLTPAGPIYSNVYTVGAGK
jgi:2'-5' RNA ligase